MNTQQQSLLDQTLDYFSNRQLFKAGFLLGSFASNTQDMLSDFDLCIITAPDVWRDIECHGACLLGRNDIIYKDVGYHQAEGAYARCIFNDFTSIELHLIDEHSDFPLYEPFKILFEDGNVIERFRVGGPPPGKKDSKAMSFGVESVGWDLFNVFKMGVRGKVESIDDWVLKYCRERQLKI